MTTDRAAFLATIAESPLDPVPRLVYADWLYEHGDIDGEFEQRLEAHLLAIRAAPDDDAPRLAYAGWLTTREAMVECHHCGGGREGEWCYPSDDDGRCLTCSGTGRVSNGLADRAEFIRVQIELNRLLIEPEPARYLECSTCNARRHGRQHTNGPCRCEPSLKDLRRRERELRPGTTTLEAPHSAPMYLSGPMYERGFISRVRWRWQEHAIYWPALRSHPDVVLRRVELTTWPDVKTQWTTHPARLRVWMDDHAAIGTASAGNPHNPPAYTDLVRLGTVDMLNQRFPGHCPNHPIKWVLPADTRGERIGAMSVCGFCDGTGFSRSQDYRSVDVCNACNGAGVITHRG